MNNSLFSVDESNGALILDSNTEQRMFACNLISGIEKSQHHIRFILTTEGSVALAEALSHFSTKESFDDLITTQKSLFPDINDELIIKKDLMKGLNISHTTLWKWEKTGYLVPVKVGKRTYYRREDIQKLIQ